MSLYVDGVLASSVGFSPGLLFLVLFLLVFPLVTLFSLESPLSLAPLPPSPRSCNVKFHPQIPPTSFFGSTGCPWFGNIFCAMATGWMTASTLGLFFTQAGSL
ncbi:hypothetical protein C8F04DRAFT_1137997, partial [Mycena alexandri]